MIAKQYPIALPTDYDMNIIRRRVAGKGETFDGRPGLLFKAFLISERSRGAPLNQYAPFYAWNETAALWDFVAGDGFDGIVKSFGRPSILTWLPLTIEIRQGLRRDAVRSALRVDMPIPVDADLPAFRRAQVEANKSALANDPGIALCLTAANIERWSMVRFTLRYDQPAETAPRTQAYEVLHLSAPGVL
jgi:hypothetical protein